MWVCVCPYVNIQVFSLYFDIYRRSFVEKGKRLFHIYRKVQLRESRKFKVLVFYFLRDGFMFVVRCCCC